MELCNQGASRLVGEIYKGGWKCFIARSRPTFAVLEAIRDQERIAGEVDANLKCGRAVCLPAAGVSGLHCDELFAVGFGGLIASLAIHCE
jgi:hypothetical protein